MFGSLSRREALPLTRWNAPWSLFRDMDEMLRSAFAENALAQPETTIPSIDVAETENAVEVTTDVPGYTADEINIEVGENSLNISGKHSEETKSEEDEKKTYHRIERRSGSFSRYVQLPCAVDRKSVEAELTNGVLKIHLPKAEPTKTRKVKIKG